MLPVRDVRPCCRSVFMTNDSFCFNRVCHPETGGFFYYLILSLSRLSFSGGKCHAVNIFAVPILWWKYLICTLVGFFYKGSRANFSDRIFQKAHTNVNYDSLSSFGHHVPGWLFFCFIDSAPWTEACLPVRELNAHRMTGGCRGECVRMQTSVHGTERVYWCSQ